MYEGEVPMDCRMHKRRFVIAGAIVALLVFLLPALGCPQEEGEQVMPREKVAVLPFVVIEPLAPEERMVKGMWGNFFFRTGALPARAGSEVTAIFHRQLDQLDRCEVIPLHQMQAAVEEVNPGVLRQDPVGVAAQIGRELGVYAVVIGGVYRFEQRRGSAVGVENPASAAFDAHLVHVADEKVIWSGRFDETQHSLSENLLKISSFLKGGAHWVTVERWAAIGVESILRTFPVLGH
jgi:hypothetical protein